MRRHWVYWRSPFHGDQRVLATRIDDDGAGYVMRRLDLANEPEMHYRGRIREQQWLWRISEKEARAQVRSQRDRLGALAREEVAR